MIGRYIWIYNLRHKLVYNEKFANQLNCFESWSVPTRHFFLDQFLVQVKMCGNIGDNTDLSLKLQVKLESCGTDYPTFSEKGNMS